MKTSFDVAVLDYGMGNLHSVSKALQHVAPDATVYVGAEPETILAANRIVYPGVGAIRDCIAEVKRLGLDQLISKVVKSKPLLAICVGMQGLMRRSSENNGVDCLGFFDYDVDYFSDHFEGTSYAGALKVPHMGWNAVEQSRTHPLWHGIQSGARFYFVHSYFVPSEGCSEATGIVTHGVDVVAAIARDNVFATQFHPEKSHRDGLKLLENFMCWDGG